MSITAKDLRAGMTVFDEANLQVFYINEFTVMTNLDMTTPNYIVMTTTVFQRGHAIPSQRRHEIGDGGFRILEEAATTESLLNRIRGIGTNGVD